MTFPFGLTEQQCRYAILIGRGLTQVEIAKLTRRNITSVQRLLHRARMAAKAKTNAHLAVKVAVHLAKGDK